MRPERLGKFKNVEAVPTNRLRPLIFHILQLLIINFRIVLAG
jgi:hypothetical protein